MRARSGLIATALVIATIGGTAWAAKGISTFLWAFPGYDAQWQKGEGVPDGTKSQQGLRLEKTDPDATTEFGAGVTFTNVEGTALNQPFGFEVRDDGRCDDFPRYRVHVPDPASTAEEPKPSFVYFFRCHRGTHTPSTAGWTTVTFSEIDAEPEKPLQPLFTFGTEIEYLALMLHIDVGETGPSYTILDNFNINGKLIGKPGR